LGLKILVSVVRFRPWPPKNQCVALRIPSDAKLLCDSRVIAPQKASEQRRSFSGRASLSADVLSFLRLRSDKSEHLHRRRIRVAIEDRVDVLHDVGAHVEEVPLVLDGD
jgi:hypothetical protein